MPRGGDRGGRRPRKAHDLHVRINQAAADALVALTADGRSVAAAVERALCAAAPRTDPEIEEWIREGGVLPPRPRATRVRELLEELEPEWADDLEDLGLTATADGLRAYAAAELATAARALARAAPDLGDLEDLGPTTVDLDLYALDLYSGWVRTAVELLRLLEPLDGPPAVD